MEAFSTIHMQMNFTVAQKHLENDIARDFKLLSVSDTILEKHNDFQHVTVCVSS